MYAGTNVNKTNKV